MHDIVRQLSESTGYPAELILADLRESCETMRLMSEAVLPLVDRLRERGVRCFIATDNMDTFTAFTVPALGLADRFDDILNSFEKGMLKQDGTDGVRIPFFDEYLSLHGLRHDEAVLIDDSGYGEAYTRAGLETIRIASGDEVETVLRELLDGTR